MGVPPTKHFHDHRGTLSATLTVVVADSVDTHKRSKRRPGGRFEEAKRKPGGVTAPHAMAAK